MPTPTNPAQPSEALISLASEKALLGALLTDPNAFDAIAGMTRPEHFSEELHQDIFRAISAQRSDGLPSTPASLSFVLKDRWATPIEGLGLTFGQYTASLIADSVTAFDLADYSRTLRDLAALRGIEQIGLMVRSGSGETPSSTLESALSALDEMRSDLAEHESTRRPAGEVVAATLNMAKALRDGTALSTAVTTGFVSLDAEMIGYRPADLVLVGGRPGMGKTAYATSSAVKVARTGAGVLFFSLELSADDIGARLLADLGSSSNRRIHFSSIMRGTTLMDMDLKALDRATDEIRYLPLEIDAASSLTIGDLSARVHATRKRFEAKGTKLKVVFIDFLKQMRASDRYRGNLNNEIGEITTGLRKVAKDNDLCIVLLVQLNRGVEGREDKRPDLMDLRDSGNLEQDADTVMFLYRAAYYLKDNPEAAAAAKHRLEVILAKNRKGPCTTVDLWVDIAASMLRDADWLGRGNYGEAA